MMHLRRGFALLIAIILTSVLLAVGIALLDIAYKQVLLASGSKNSQYAFYNADSGLECALYWDQKFNAFDYSSPMAAGSIKCSNIAVQGYSTTKSGSTRTTNFTVPCPGSGTSASVSVYKQSNGTTNIYSNGYNTCVVSSPNRIERGLKAQY